MITKDKVTEIFCIIDEFNKNLNTKLKNTFFYLLITVKENVIETVKVVFLKARL